MLNVVYGPSQCRVYQSWSSWTLSPFCCWRWFVSLIRSVLLTLVLDGAAGYLCRTEPKECETLSPAWPSSSPYVTAIGGTQFSKDVYPWCNYPGMVCSKVKILLNELLTTSSFILRQVGEVTSSSSTGSRITTGGGFSNLFAQPGYQTQAVKGYLGKTGVPASAFNSTGAFHSCHTCAFQHQCQHFLLRYSS